MRTYQRQYTSFVYALDEVYSWREGWFNNERIRGSEDRRNWRSKRQSTVDFKNKGEGKTHQYVAKVTRAEYTRQTMQEVKKDFFGGSIKKMLCFFVEEEKLTAEEIQGLLEEIEESEEFAAAIPSAAKS